MREKNSHFSKKGKTKQRRGLIADLQWINVVGVGQLSAGKKEMIQIGRTEMLPVIAY